MKIVYLNVWGDEMRDNLIEYLEEQAQNTDVFCFQEATGMMKRRCASALSDYKEFSSYKYVSEDEYFCQSIFVKKSIDVASSGTLMPVDADCGLSNYIEIRLEHTNMFICNVHGKSRPGHKLDDEGRIKQSKELVEFFEDRNSPIVIGGDFNILPDTKSIKMFAEAGYRDLIKDYKIDTTRNRHAWDRYPTKMYYSDYVFLNDKIKLKNFSVPKNEVSDHLPLIIEIDI